MRSDAVPFQFSKANEQSWDTSEGEFIDGSLLHTEGIKPLLR